MEELTKEIIKLMPRITDKKAKFTEEEMPTIKAFFEKITHVSVGNMMNCGGHLCEDVRRSIVNYMASFKHVTPAEPKKTKLPTAKPEKASPETNRDELMAEALKLAEAKGIKKPHYKSGADKLIKYINENK